MDDIYSCSEASHIHEGGTVKFIIWSYWTLQMVVCSVRRTVDDTYGSVDEYTPFVEISHPWSRYYWVHNLSFRWSCFVSLIALTLVFAAAGKLQSSFAKKTELRSFLWLQSGFLDSLTTWSAEDWLRNLKSFQRITDFAVLQVWWWSQTGGRKGGGRRRGVGCGVRVCVNLRCCNLYV
jgi:hypothetical protein